MSTPQAAGGSSALEEAARELEAAEHDARVAFDCIALGELDRAHTSAVTARVAVDAAVTALQAALAQGVDARLPDDARGQARQPVRRCAWILANSSGSMRSAVSALRPREVSASAVSPSAYRAPSSMCSVPM